MPGVAGTADPWWSTVRTETTGAAAISAVLLPVTSSPAPRARGGVDPRAGRSRARPEPASSGGGHRRAIPTRAPCPGGRGASDGPRRLPGKLSRGRRRVRGVRLRDDGPAEHHRVVFVHEVVAVRHVRSDEVTEPAVEHGGLGR